VFEHLTVLCDSFTTDDSGPEREAAEAWALAHIVSITAALDRTVTRVPGEHHLPQERRDNGE
jgi:hypothetical protein